MVGLGRGWFCQGIYPGWFQFYTCSGNGSRRNQPQVFCLILQWSYENIFLSIKNSPLRGILYWYSSRFQSSEKFHLVFSHDTNLVKINWWVSITMPNIIFACPITTEVMEWIHCKKTYMVAYHFHSFWYSLDWIINGWEYWRYCCSNVHFTS